MSDSCCGAAIDTQFLADARRRRMLIINAALAALLIRTSIGIIHRAGRELRTHGHAATTFG